MMGATTDPRDAAQRASEDDARTGIGGGVLPLADNAYEYPVRVRFSDVDHRGAMTIPAMINAFQDASTFQSETIGQGSQELVSEGRAWVLTHWHIVIDRYPLQYEDIRVGTFASRFRGVLANRNFYLRSSEGDLLVRADSSWGFIDLSSGRLVRPEEHNIAGYGEHEPLPMPHEPRRISLPDGLADCEPVVLRRHHIDVNEHMNNCQYVLLALDLLPAEEHPHRIRVDYRRSAVLGDTLYPKIAHAGDRSVISLQDADGGVFATVEFERNAVQDQ